MIDLIVLVETRNEVFNRIAISVQVKVLSSIMRRVGHGWSSKLISHLSTLYSTSTFYKLKIIRYYLLSVSKLDWIV